MEAPRQIRILDLSREDSAWPGEAAEGLRSGGVIALPTETFYGLAVDPASTTGVTRLLELKGYPLGRSLLLLADSLDQANELCHLRRSASALALADAFWPGPLTLVLPAVQGIDLPACPLGSVAVRVPGAEAPRRLARELGRPVTGTSANTAGAPPAECAADVRTAFPTGLELILDGGATPGGKPSTLLDLTGSRPRMLREGAVSRSQLEELLGISLHRRRG